MSAKTYIFHIARISDWNLATNNNNFYKCSSLESVKFIHASKITQLNFVLNKFYENNQDIILLKIDTQKLISDIRWESSEKDIEPFPHIYGPINLDSVVETVESDKIRNYLKYLE